MDLKQTVDGVKNDIKNVNSIADVKWYMPFLAVVVLGILFFTHVAFLTWICMIASFAVFVWVLIEQVGNKKASPLKVDWYWFLLVSVIIGIFLYSVFIPLSLQSISKNIELKNGKNSYIYQAATEWWAMKSCITYYNIEPDSSLSMIRENKDSNLQDRVSCFLM